MSNNANPEDTPEALVVSLVGIILVLAIAGVAYYLIATSAPREFNDFNLPLVNCIGIYGLFFFLYGLVGVIQGKIVVGWGTMRQVQTTLGDTMLLCIQT
ncbi:MAG: hypothetical protein FJZ87_11175 [Chloroflexi bacterium]|nr:hypothetical protein [Chloroflexota bacterium]